MVDLGRRPRRRDDEEFDPQEEDEAAAEFTLSRGSAETVEELDLAAMVDVAFQLVLFFLVTATTVLYKTLEVPRPNPESNPAAAAAQGQSKTLDDLKDDYILVEIDPAGAVKIDHEPVPAEMPALVERLRALRERTGRKAMLLSADFSTPHRSAVLAYDAANEIGLGIAIARPEAGAGAPDADADGRVGRPGMRRAVRVSRRAVTRPTLPAVARRFAPSSLTRVSAWLRTCSIGVGWPSGGVDAGGLGGVGVLPEVGLGLVGRVGRGSAGGGRAGPGPRATAPGRRRPAGGRAARTRACWSATLTRSLASLLTLAQSVPCTATQ